MRNKKMNTSLPSIFSNQLNLRNEFLTPFDTLFDKFFNESFPTFHKELGVNFFQNQSYPKCNVVDFPDRLIIEAAVPGLDSENVDVDLLENTLTISAAKQERDTDEGHFFIRRELKQSAFKRSFQLGDCFEVDNIEATFKNGVLTIVIPKIQPEKVDEPIAKRIDIKKD
jgi:HSP20 family protein